MREPATNGAARNRTALDTLERPLAAVGDASGESSGVADRPAGIRIVAALEHDLAGSDPGKQHPLDQSGAITEHPGDLAMVTGPNSWESINKSGTAK
jgi:hypothetical protein